MNAPRTINEYLEQLRAALRGADPALIQDALYDAEEHLRAELADYLPVTLWLCCSIVEQLIGS